MGNFKVSKIELNTPINIYRGRRTKASLKVCKSSPTMPPLPPTVPPTAPCPPAAFSKCVGCPPCAVPAGGIMLSPLVAKPATPLAPPLNWWWWLLCRLPPWWCSGLGDLEYNEWIERKRESFVSFGGMLLACTQERTHRRLACVDCVGSVLPAKYANKSSRRIVRRFLLRAQSASSRVRLW